MYCAMWCDGLWAKGPHRKSLLQITLNAVHIKFERRIGKVEDENWMNFYLLDVCVRVAHCILGILTWIHILFGQYKIQFTPNCTLRTHICGKHIRPLK